MRIERLYIGLIVLLTLPAFSQELISLKRSLSETMHDTARCRLLNQIIEMEVDDEVWPAFNDQLYDLAEKNLKTTNAQLRKIYLRYYAGALSNKGIIYDNQGDIPRSLEYYTKSIKYLEELNEKRELATTLNNLGVLYENQGDYSRSLHYLNKGLKIREEIKDSAGIAASHLNLSVYYGHRGDTLKAYESLEISLKLQQVLGEKQGMAYTLNNLGTLSLNTGDLEKALIYFKRSLEICHQISEKRGMTLCYNNIAMIFKTKRQLKQARIYSDSALFVAWKLGFPENIMEAEFTATRIDSAMGNFEGAFNHYRNYILFKDSISNEETRKAAYKSQLQFDYDKKETMLKEQQERERLVAKEKSRFRLVVIWTVVSGLVLLFIFLVFIYRNLQRNKRSHRIITEKQKEILASIHYANRIQKALMPNERYFEKEFKRLKHY